MLKGFVSAEKRVWRTDNFVFGEGIMICEEQHRAEFRHREQLNMNKKTYPSTCACTNHNGIHELVCTNQTPNPNRTVSDLSRKYAVRNTFMD